MSRPCQQCYMTNSKMSMLYTQQRFVYLLHPGSDPDCSGVVGNCIAKNNHRFFAGFLLAAQAGCILLCAGAAWKLQQRGVFRWIGPENFLILFLAVVYGYHSVLLLFGTFHCLAILLDITTKELVSDKHLWHNPPCRPGSRSPARLLQAWRTLCCGPIRFRQHQHVWQAVPASEQP
eukprot:GHRR01020720.1.p1 GENE.GHRR01020720.1~~GHRR01020720.1.p1  ORF type:complete len:176 (+),score=40.19 GHRR01020720.1:770-1297(+)